MTPKVLEILASFGTDIAEDYISSRTTSRAGEASKKRELKQKLESYLNEQNNKSVLSTELTDDFDIEGLFNYLKKNLPDDDVLKGCFDPDKKTRDQAQRAIIDTALTWASPMNPESADKVKRITIASLQLISNFFQNQIKLEDSVLAVKIVDAVDGPVQNAKNDVVGAVQATGKKLLEEIQKPEDHNYHKISTSTALFLPRDTLIAQIEQALKQSRIVMISGFGGTGKSELVREYAQRHAKDYDAYEITCPDNKELNLDELLQNAQGKPDLAKRTDWSRSTLLIVDNFNDETQGKFLQEICDNTGEATILITSRISDFPLDDNFYHLIEMPDQSSPALEEECFKIFKMNYEQGQSLSLHEDEESKVREIILETGMNIYVTVLLAVSCRENGGIDELDDIIHDTEIYDRKDHVRSRKRKTPEEYIADLILKDLSNIGLETWHVQVLITLSIMPAYRFKKENICKILGDSGKHKKILYAMEELFERRWILSNGDDVYIHPLIAQAIEFDKVHAVLLACENSPYSDLHAFYERMLCNWIFEPSQEVLLMAVIWSLWKDDNFNKYLDLICRSNLNPIFERLESGIYITATGEHVITLCRFSLDGDLQEKVFEAYFGYNDSAISSKKAENVWNGNCIAAFANRDFELDLETIERKYNIQIRTISQKAFFENEHVTGVLYLSENLTTIGDGAFGGGCRGLKSITFPQSLTVIGDWAFDGCTGLKNIRLPKNLTAIGDGAFDGCTGLKSTTFPQNLTVIGDWAFYNCTCLESTTFPQSLTVIGDWAFSGCTGLKSTTFPKSLTAIGDGVFYDCRSLTNITFPESLVTIGDSAFSGCTGFKNITFPKNLTAIGDRAFYGCTDLNNITFSKNLTIIKDSVFSGCTALKNITFPKNLTAIGDWAFVSCKDLESITFPESLTAIGDWTFYNCTGLKDITFPESVTTIGDRAFYGCTGLKNIILPKNLMAIGFQAFPIGCTLIFQ